MQDISDLIADYEDELVAARTPVAVDYVVRLLEIGRGKGRYKWCVIMREWNAKRVMVFSQTISSHSREDLADKKAKSLNDRDQAHVSRVFLA